MLKVIVDATPITIKPSGVGLYVANLINSLVFLQQQLAIEIDIFYQPPFKKWLRRDFSLPNFLNEDCSLNKNVFPYPVRVTNWVVQNYPQLLTNLLDSKLKSYDLFHGTNFSVYPDRQTAKVMTLYDLTFLRYPQYIDKVVAKYNQRVKQCLPWTDLVLAISESTKQDAAKYLGIPTEKIVVTPLASRYSSNYLDDVDLEKLKSQVDYDFAQPYLLFVSTIEPRKNIITLIKAFNYLKQKHHIPHNLILIGRKGWSYEPIFAEIMASPDQGNIYHLDYLSDRLVALFYKLASVFVYPSHYEGFGLPVLEAMTLGAPVVCADTSSLPEVAGEGAILINPNEPLELAEVVLNVLSSSSLRDRLIHQGYEQAKKFSWKKTAMKTVAAYKMLS